MSPDQPQSSGRVYQLKVVLRDCSLMNWRRFLMASDTSLGQLHTIIQIAMGRQVLHLHRFRISGEVYGIYREGCILFDDNPFQALTQHS